MRVLYLDIDGTVRHGFDELGRFVNGPDDVVIFDGVRERIRRYKANGWRIAGVSNQGGVALGIVSMELVVAAMQRTDELLGGVFDSLGICVHHPNATDPEMQRCYCRKPRAGLVFEVNARMATRAAFAGFPEYYPPHLALFVGDRDEDLLCADAAAVDFMWAKDWRAHGEPS